MDEDGGDGEAAMPDVVTSVASGVQAGCGSDQAEGALDVGAPLVATPAGGLGLGIDRQEPGLLANIDRPTPTVAQRAARAGTVVRVAARALEQTHSGARVAGGVQKAVCTAGPALRGEGQTCAGQVLDDDGQGLGQLAVAVENGLKAEGDEEAIDRVVVMRRIGEGGAEGDAGAVQTVTGLAEGIHQSQGIVTVGGPHGEDQGQMVATIGVGQGVGGATEQKAVVGRVVTDARGGVTEETGAGATALGAGAGLVTMAVGPASEQGAVSGSGHRRFGGKDALPGATADRFGEEGIPDVLRGGCGALSQVAQQPRGTTRQLTATRGEFLAAWGFGHAPVATHDAAEATGGSSG